MKTVRMRALRGTVMLQCRLIAGGAILYAAASAMPVAAQATEEAGRALEAERELSGERDIIVTARRREESLERVPASITAFGAEELQKRAIVSESDLQRVTPGLIVREANSNNQINYALRGQTIDAYTSSPPGVLAYYNDVQFSYANASSLFDLQSVQVLKGPQGTLFGRNTTGGAILYTTAQPRYETEGYFTARFGTYERAEIEGALNIPISTDRVALRVAGSLARREGYVLNLLDGKDLGRKSNEAIRASLRLDPSDAISSTTVYEFSSVGGTNLGGSLYSLYAPGGNVNSLVASLYGPSNPLFAQYAAANPFVDPLGIEHFFLTQKERGPYRVEENSPGTLKVKSHRITNTTTVELGPDVIFKNIVGWSRTVGRFGQDVDGTPYNIFGYGPFTVGAPVSDTPGQYMQTRQYSEEAQIQGDAGGLSYILGGYYSYQSDVNQYLQNFFDFGPAVPGGVGGIHSDTVQKSQALFAQGTLDFGAIGGPEGFKATGGIRYTWVQVGARQLALSAFLGAPDLSVKFRRPSWTVGLEYQATPELLLYANQRGSWRSGGINGQGYPSPGTADVGGSFFNSETVEDVEVGAKYRGELGTMPFRFNIAAYDSWVKNIQRVVYVQLATPTALTVNVPAAKVSGVEADVDIELAPWLRVGGALAYTDARFTRGSTLLFGQATNFGPYPDTPEWAGSLFAEISVPAPGDLGELVLRGEYFGQTKTYFSSTAATITPETDLKSYGLANFRIALNGIAGSNFDAAIFVNNAFDVTYYTGGLQTGSVFGLNTAIPGAPRMVAGELRFKF